MTAATSAPAKPAKPTGFIRQLVTPEGVDLRVELASGAQRATAFFLDMVFMGGALVALTLACLFFLPIFGMTAAEPLLVIWLLGSFVLRSAWFLMFEFGARAATPGKRLLGLRVISRNGGRLTADAIIARNAMREIELFLPLTFLGFQGGVDGWIYLLGFLWSGVFAFFPLFNRDRMRVGDLVAGTWVVQRPRRKMVADLTEASRATLSAFAFTTAQLDAYGVKELQVLEDVLRKRHGPTQRAVADRIRSKIGWVPRAEESDAAFLDAYYAGLRGRLEGRLLLGRRRRDKHDTG